MSGAGIAGWRLEVSAECSGLVLLAHGGEDAAPWVGRLWLPASADKCRAPTVAESRAALASLLRVVLGCLDASEVSGERGRLHAAAAGALCSDDGSGCCGGCGVSLGEPCGTCEGRGYHRTGCPCYGS